MIKKNFPIIVDGEEYWFSRSLACACVTFAYDRNGVLHVLANKRGVGAKFNVGKWNIPGGFIDFNEDAKTCAIRETYEETGVELNPDTVRFLELNTEPSGTRQTMIARFTTIMDTNIENIKLTTEYSEEDEVEEIRWFPVETNKDRENLKKHAWTRDQLKYISIALGYVKRNEF